MTSSNNRLEEIRHDAFETDSAQTLQRALGPTQLVLLGIGAIIGAGIFVAAGTVAANHAGPAIVLSFVLAAVACLCTALCYAEFAAMLPVSGSAYSYVYATFGETAGWLIAWCLILEYLMAGATIAVGWSGYFVGLLGSMGFEISPAIASPPFAFSVAGGVVNTGAIVNLPALLLLAVLTCISLGRVQMSMRANACLVIVKLTVIGLFIVCGAFFVDSSNWHPFLPPNAGSFGEFGWSGVLRGAGIIFYAYLGFDAVSTAARETRHPQRSMPIAIVGALVICTLIYIAFAFVLTGLAPYTALSVPNPVSVAVAHAGPRLVFLKATVEIGALIGLTSVLLVLLYALSRILYALARDGLVPAVFARLGARSRAPYAAVISGGLIAALIAGLFPVEALSQLISIGTLTAFMFVCGGVLVLRARRPEIERPFRVPLAPLVSGAGILICGYLMAVLPEMTWRRFLVWMALGGALYLSYGRRHASEMRLSGLGAENGLA